MNLIRLGPELRLDQPLPPGEVGEGIVSVAPLEDIIPEGGITEELRAGVLTCTATAAHWRQAAFDNEQAARLDGPQDLDAKRNMTEEMADLHRGELAKHLAALGVTESVEQHPSAIADFDLEVAMAA